MACENDGFQTGSEETRDDISDKTKTTNQLSEQDDQSITPSPFSTSSKDIYLEHQLSGQDDQSITPPSCASPTKYIDLGHQLSVQDDQSNTPSPSSDSPTKDIDLGHQLNGQDDQSITPSPSSDSPTKDIDLGHLLSEQDDQSITPPSCASPTKDIDLGHQLIGQDDQNIIPSPSSASPTKDIYLGHQLSEQKNQFITPSPSSASPTKDILLGHQLSGQDDQSITPSPSCASPTKDIDLGHQLIGQDDQTIIPSPSSASPTKDIYLGHQLSEQKNQSITPSSSSASTIDIDLGHQLSGLVNQSNTPSPSSASPTKDIDLGHQLSGQDDQSITPPSCASTTKDIELGHQLSGQDDQSNTPSNSSDSATKDIDFGHQLNGQNDQSITPSPSSASPTKDIVFGHQLSGQDDHSITPSPSSASPTNDLILGHQLSGQDVQSITPSPSSAYPTKDIHLEHKLSGEDDQSIIPSPSSASPTKDIDLGHQLIGQDVQSITPFPSSASPTKDIVFGHQLSGQDDHSITPSPSSASPTNDLILGHQLSGQDVQSITPSPSSAYPTKDIHLEHKLSGEDDQSIIPSPSSASPTKDIDLGHQLSEQKNQSITPSSSSASTIDIDLGHQLSGLVNQSNTPSPSSASPTKDIDLGHQLSGQDDQSITPPSCASTSKDIELGHQLSGQDDQSNTPSNSSDSATKDIDLGHQLNGQNDQSITPSPSSASPTKDIVFGHQLSGQDDHSITPSPSSASPTNDLILGHQLSGQDVQSITPSPSSAYPTKDIHLEHKLSGEDDQSIIPSPSSASPTKDIDLGHQLIGQDVQSITPFPSSASPTKDIVFGHQLSGQDDHSITPSPSSASPTKDIVFGHQLSGQDDHSITSSPSCASPTNDLILGHQLSGQDVQSITPSPSSAYPTKDIHLEHKLSVQKDQSITPSPSSAYPTKDIHLEHKLSVQKDQSITPSPSRASPTKDIVFGHQLSGQDDHSITPSPSSASPTKDIVFGHQLSGQDDHSITPSPSSASPTNDLILGHQLSGQDVQSITPSPSSAYSTKDIHFEHKLSGEDDQSIIPSPSSASPTKDIDLGHQLIGQDFQSITPFPSSASPTKDIVFGHQLSGQDDHSITPSPSSASPTNDLILGHQLSGQDVQSITPSPSSAYPTKDIHLEHKLSVQKDQSITPSSSSASTIDIDLGHQLSGKDDQSITPPSCASTTKDIELGHQLSGEDDQSIIPSPSSASPTKNIVFGHQLSELDDLSIIPSPSSPSPSKDIVIGHDDQSITPSPSSASPTKDIHFGHQLNGQDDQSIIPSPSSEQDDQTIIPSPSSASTTKDIVLGHQLSGQDVQSITPSPSSASPSKDIVFGHQLSGQDDHSITPSPSSTSPTNDLILGHQLSGQDVQPITPSPSSAYPTKDIVFGHQLSGQDDHSITPSPSSAPPTKDIDLVHQLSGQDDQSIAPSPSSASTNDLILGHQLSGQDDHSISPSPSSASPTNDAYLGHQLNVHKDVLLPAPDTSYPHQRSQQSDPFNTCSSSITSPTATDNELQSTLSSIGCKQPHIDFILQQGERYLEKPLILAKKLKVSQNFANILISALKDYKRKPAFTLSSEYINKIEICLNENPDIDSQEDIALLCDIEEALVSAYFESKPLNEVQKNAIREKYNVGYNVADIVNILKLSNQKVQDYVESTFLTFTSEEGKKILGIIQNSFGEIKLTKLREMVISKNLKLQDQLCYFLRERDDAQYRTVEDYFNKFAESKSFFKVDMKLTIEDILHIKQCSFDNIEQLSIKLQKVETVIRDYLRQYSPNEVVRNHHTLKQVDQIHEIVNNFGKDELSFQTYRMIISESFEDMIRNADKIWQNPKETFLQLLPLSFYYLKCSLPLEDITQIIANSGKITLTTHDVFHIIFQLSDPVLRGFCIEHYSFSNPVPFYYPLLKNSSSLKSKEAKFAICKELWYSLQPFNGLVSFGLGRAGWNPIGKSHLLDLIFDTDFEKGNPPNSAFHFNSIDIQMAKNLFGEMKDKSSAESTKWAYIDCHGNSNLPIIQVICQHLDIALIHVSYSDYSTNFSLLEREVYDLVRLVTHVYFLIRDCKLGDVKVESINTSGLTVKIVFIPDLTKQDIQIHSVKKSLKVIGYEILHLHSKNPKLIGSDFLENVLDALEPHSSIEIQSDKKLIQNITNHMSKMAQSSCAIDFSFLTYYPLFIDYMSCYHKASNETDQKIIDELNIQSGKLGELLMNAPMEDIVLYFNEILMKKNSTLILWKLSQELSHLSKQIVRCIQDVKQDNVIEQKNDKYTIEILWREALLSNKYGNVSEKNRDYYKEEFATNFSNHVERGEAFELIDGDNLRFFNKDIDALLFKFYERQFNELGEINKGKKVQLKQAPIVVSIFGPQSSGKSTLLNYCFGCKFLTSAGRCTRGVYGSLSRLSRTVNLTDHFLILDTEGLDAIERGNIQDTSMIHFDRTMVLFCLSVSQVVIINVKGDIGSEMQNLLQICAYSLNRLKVRKVAAPKIFFVLNQQADPDPAKHLDSINILMEKLTKESDLMDTEGIKISDLIQVSRDNLFILPSAFNSEQINKPGSKLFDSKVIKLSPTVTFADKCADLRLAIIQQLDTMATDDRAPFNTMSEWMDMSGTIWDTIIKYQDIVKYRNVEELMCSNLLRALVSELMKKNIYSNQEMFQKNTEKLLLEINEIETLFHPNIILTKVMTKFDDDYNMHQDDCLTEFTNKCRNDTRLKKMNHICDEQKSNLSRLIYIERKNHEDKLKYHIKAVLTEIKLSESMKMFQEAIIKNVDKYLEINVEDQKIAFEETWIECFGTDDRKEEDFERDEIFDDLYSIFKMELRTMENKPAIYELFRNLNFIMDDIINSINSELLSRFQSNPKLFKGTDQFIYHCSENNVPIKDMNFFGGKGKYEYLGKYSLFQYTKVRHYYILTRHELKISKWIPNECHPLVQYCSGYYNHPDITWNKLDKSNQILLLASLLKAPENFTLSTWNKFVNNITTNIQEFIDRDPNISQGTVKELVNFLYSLYKIVNYEIGYIEAKLSNTAERMISTYVFAMAFKSLWETKTKKRFENKSKTETKKSNLLQYFLQKIENRKMVRGKWDRVKMRDSDQKISKQFAKDLLEGVQRGVVTGQQPIIQNYFKDRRGGLSHESIFLSADDTITKELSTSDPDPDPEIVDIDNFAVQYICNRNELIKIEFQRQWDLLTDELYVVTVEEMKIKFTKQVGTLKRVLKKLLDSLVDRCDKSESACSENKAFDSDSNFELAEIGVSKEVGTELSLKGRESPFKAMLTYLRMYLDPKVTSLEFDTFFANIFMVDDVKIKLSDTFILCDKLIDPTNVLDEDTFKKLSNTKMFHSENIFNIHEYISNFLSILTEYEYKLTKAEFEELIRPMKEEFEKDVIGCPSRCPTCGKLCERELHPNDGNCQIKTGHQICSMGGNVWNNDGEKSAVLFMCDDYTDNTRVLIPGYTMNWGQFKEKCGNDWDWTLPKDEKYSAKQRSNREKMIKIWNKFGKGILKYYLQTHGTKIKYIPYTSVDEVYKTQLSVEYNICFVIDGTGSMCREIEKARISVGQFISKYKERGTESKFTVVIYRDHCDKNIIEMFPNNNKFTSQYETIQTFLEGVEASGGGDYPEAVLDGLATAATRCEWDNNLGTRNVIIHIFDAPPHGDFPNYKSHSRRSDESHCCCCNYGKLCHFDWEKDVWKIFCKLRIQYNGINTGGNLPEFEEAMKSNLGELCGDFQVVGKEIVNDAILQIFIDYESK